MQIDAGGARTGGPKCHVVAKWERTFGGTLDVSERFVVPRRRSIEMARHLAPTNSVGKSLSVCRLIILHPDIHRAMCVDD